MTLPLTESLSATYLDFAYQGSSTFVKHAAVIPLDADLEVSGRH
jgi:hypothetical protein